MSTPQRPPFDDSAAEADVIEQQTTLVSDDTDDEDRWQDVAAARDRDADEADLIEQSIAVPDDDRDIDR